MASDQIARQCLLAKREALLFELGRLRQRLTGQAVNRRAILTP